MHFFTPTIDVYGKYKPILQVDELTCENLHLNALIWQDIYHYEYAEFDEKTLIIRLWENGGYIYLLPVGESFVPALEQIISMLGANDRLTASDGPRLEKLLSYMGDRIELIPVEENFDYIYNSADLAQLSGKKYHQKRNHISAFTRRFNWRYESLCDDNLNDIIKVAELWAGERLVGEDDEDIECELRAVKSILPHHDQLDIRGGILYVDDTPAAFTFGSPINGCVFDVTTEKALGEFAGAYAVINNEFVKNELFPKYKYVNREDDLGIEGLRRAKRSYNPEIILKKYLVEIKKP